MSLVLLIYIAGLVLPLSLFLGMIGVVSIVVTSIYMAAEQTVTSISFRILMTGLMCCLLATLIPSKTTVYMMAGAVAGIEIAKHESMQQVPDILTKTIKLINKELDNKLEEVVR